MKFPVKVYDNGECRLFTDENALKEFAKNYRVIYAAGGVVADENGRVLMIFRSGKWDFPKGKIEVNESSEEAAVREVCEETGLKDVRLLHLLHHTFHTYVLHDKKILKKTSWYAMQANATNFLIPQEEEDITDVQWVEKEKVTDLLQTSYPSLSELWQTIQA